MLYQKPCLIVKANEKVEVILEKIPGVINRILSLPLKLSNRPLSPETAAYVSFVSASSTPRLLETLLLSHPTAFTMGREDLQLKYTYLIAMTSLEEFSESAGFVVSALCRVAFIILKDYEYIFFVDYWLNISGLGSSFKLCFSIYLIRFR